MIEQTMRSSFAAAASAVNDRREEINKLNVFPVPDGDTGTNMALTLGSVVRELDELPPDATMAKVAEAVRHGLSLIHIWRARRRGQRASCICP